MPYRMRRPQQVVDEFKADEQPYAVFIDNNLGSRRDYLHALCNALRPLNKIWSAAVTIDVTDDPSLIRNMALAGCTGVFVGFESLSDDNLAAAHKKTDARSDSKSCGVGFELPTKRTVANEKKERVLNICPCEGAKKVNGPLPRL